MDRLILWQRLEGLVLFPAGLALFGQLGAGLPWWAAILAFFAPDLSFFGYALGVRAGAITYNLVHLYAFGAGIVALGLFLSQPLLAGLGALWLAHAGFDRMLGYGLKSAEGFGITHLGRLGQAR